MFSRASIFSCCWGYFELQKDAVVKHFALKITMILMAQSAKIPIYLCNTLVKKMKLWQMNENGAEFCWLYANDMYESRSMGSSVFYLIKDCSYVILRDILIYAHF